MNKGLFTSDNAEWETPQGLFDTLNEEFGFNLDAAATAENAKCENYWTKEDDALTKPWAGRVFCNPPYGREIGKFVEKGLKEANHGSIVVMLLPARTDTRWWHDYVMLASEIRLIKGRLKFGDSKNSAPFPSCIVVFRGLTWSDIYVSAIDTKGNLTERR